MRIPLLLILSATLATAEDKSRVEFTLPFEKALVKAQAEGKLLFIKPIYGGVDALGAKDYCRGRW